MKVRRSILKETVSVQSYLGEGAYGPVYGEAVQVSCELDSTRRLVRNANGEEALSAATVIVHPADADYFGPDSLVTVAGRPSHVLSMNAQMYRGYPVLLKVVVA